MIDLTAKISYRDEDGNYNTDYSDQWSNNPCELLIELEDFYGDISAIIVEDADIE